MEQDTSTDSKIKVLLVDDNADVRMPIKMGLEMLDCAVVEAVDGESGIEQFKSTSPDVMIIDQRLPGMKGLEVAKTIRDLPEDSPVIAVLTGTDSPQLRDEATQLGVEGFFVKPISIFDLKVWIGENARRD